MGHKLWGEQGGFTPPLTWKENIIRGSGLMLANDNSSLAYLSTWEDVANYLNGLEREIQLTKKSLRVIRDVLGDFS